MHTVDGSINDARNGGRATHETDVLGQTIDLDANDFDAAELEPGPNVAAHIGNPNGSNDVEIDSSRGAIEDVSLEADDSIYVTEADAKQIPTCSTSPTRRGPRRVPPALEAFFCTARCASSSPGPGPATSA